MDTNPKDSGKNHRLKALVSGRVQGVGFRYFVEENAYDLNLTGWVRNTYDGKVEVVAEGKRNTLADFLTRLYEGPPSSDVIDVQTTWEPATGEFTSFRIRITR